MILKQDTDYLLYKDKCLWGYIIFFIGKVRRSEFKNRIKKIIKSTYHYNRNKWNYTIYSYNNLKKDKKE